MKRDDSRIGTICEIRRSSIPRDLNLLADLEDTFFLSVLRILLDNV
jgi:hypothetical protein